MLSYPDFQEKQIVLIQSEDLKNLVIQNGNLTVKEDEKTINQISLKKIFAVFIIGNTTFTSTLIQKLIREGAVIVLANKNYAPYCVIGGETEGNVLLREKQYADTETLEKAKWIIKNKIQNQILLLKNKRQKNQTEKEIIKRLVELEQEAAKANDAKSLLGLEGNASKNFFGSYFSKFNWRGRKPRTKYDELNTLLDIGYTYLFNFIEAHLRLYGFDLYKGFYHTDFYQRKSLVCDLVEPFRCIIDQALHKALALKQFDPKDFKLEQFEYRLKKGCGGRYIKIFLENIMRYKEDIFRYLQTYYRQTMKDKNDYPLFLIKK